jgi:hypothetical protein
MKRVGNGPSSAGTQAFYHHRDHLKTIKLVTDGTGASTNRRTYAPYGEKRIEEGTHTETKGYIGERHDEGEPEKAMGRGPIARRTA